MHYYQKNIPDFNNATRHLTRQERSIYSDLLELQYDLESPLPGDLDWICRRILANSESERTDVERMLNEYFDSVEQGWSNRRAEREIAHYQSKIESASKAGKASAQARQRNKKTNKTNNLEQTLNERATDVEQTCNQLITNNKQLITNKKSKDYGAIAPNHTPELVKRFVNHRKNIGHPAKTDHVIRLGMGNLQTCVDRRLFQSVADAMGYLESTEWKTLKPEYVENRNGQNRKSDQFDAASVITNSPGARDTSIGY